MSNLVLWEGQDFLSQSREVTNLKKNSLVKVEGRNSRRSGAGTGGWVFPAP